MLFTLQKCWRMHFELFGSFILDWVEGIRSAHTFTTATSNSCLLRICNWQAFYCCRWFPSVRGLFDYSFVFIHLTVCLFVVSVCVIVCSFVHDFEITSGHQDFGRAGFCKQNRNTTEHRLAFAQLFQHGSGNFAGRHHLINSIVIGLGQVANCVWGAVYISTELWIAKSDDAYYSSGRVFD